MERLWSTQINGQSFSDALHIILIMCLVIIPSCEKQPHENPDVKTVSEVLFRLYTANSELLVTKAGIQESLVDNLWVLQFNGTSDASLLIKSNYYTSPNLNALKLFLYNGSTQSVYFIANTNNSTIFNSVNAPINSYTISSLKARNVNYSNQESNFTTVGDNQYIRMSGLYTGNIPGGASLTATLYRLPAKISFSYTSIVTWDNALVKISSVTLKGVPSSSKLLSDPSNSTVSEPASVIDYSSVSSGIGETSGSATFYMPESIRGTQAGNTTPSDKALNAPVKSAYLEVTGNYYYPQNAVSPLKAVIYKIYLGDNNTTDYNVKSNSRYIITATFKGIELSDARVSTVSWYSDCDPWTSGNW
ncbi:MAG: DUF4906 domain-containing protein [Bacteroidales bacterium]